MSLLEARQWFIEASGRFDLVVDTTNYGDDGADKYIKAGQKWLDRRARFLDQTGQVFKTLAAGDYLIKLGSCRIVRRVWAGTTDAGLTELTYKMPHRFRALYPDPFDDTGQGAPRYFTLSSLREFEAVAGQGDDDFKDVDSEALDYSGLFIMPPPDQEYHITVEGDFYMDTLSDDGDENFWTKNAMNVLVKAGLRELEAFYRNYQGVNDWTNSILQDLVEIEKDFVANAYNFFDQMEG